MSLRRPSIPRCLRSLLVAAGLLFVGGQWACTDYSTYRNGEPPGQATLTVRMSLLDTLASVPDTGVSRVAFTSRWKIDRTDFVRHAYLLQLEERSDTGSRRVQHLLASPDDSIVDTLRCHPYRLRADLFAHVSDSAWLVMSSVFPTRSYP